jgi:hypothetical protein
MPTTSNRGFALVPLKAVELFYDQTMDEGQGNGLSFS